jgi:hypothetical protein
MPEGKNKLLIKDLIISYKAIGNCTLNKRLSEEEMERTKEEIIHGPGVM